MARKELSLYVHIPFCAKKCTYCAFSSCVSTRPKMEEYLHSLKNEISIRAKEVGGQRILKTIYIGGGTPSILEGEDIKGLLQHINKEFVVCQNAEITIEINPATLTEEKAKCYLSAGINRFSVGVQSVNGRLLKMLGRIHSVEDAERTIKMLQSLGAENISMDIMLGLPTQTIEDVVAAVKFAGKLKVEHISTYLLELEENTPLTKLIQGGVLSLPSENVSIKMYNALSKELEKLGFTRYELSNWSKGQDKQSQHNKVYWAREEYLGVGTSAHSFIGGERFAVVEDINGYISHLKNNTIPLEYKDKLTSEEAIEETIMLSLRTEKGINLTQLKTDFNYDLVSKKGGKIKELIKNGLMILDKENNLKLTTKGFMVINRIVVELV